MATDTAFTELRAFIVENWNFATCPLAWDNEPFDEPQPDHGVSWGRVLVDGDMWEQATIGAGTPEENRWDETGSVVFSAMVPVNTGSLLCRQRLREFANLCRGQDIGTIEFMGARFDPIGAVDDAGNWWTMSVTIEWIKRS